jgi:hypothetical protein
MRITLRHSSTSVSQVLALTPAMPALLTSMSMRPSALVVASRALVTAAASETSQATAWTFSPSAWTVLRASEMSWSQMATLAPDLRKRSDRLVEAQFVGDDLCGLQTIRLPCVASGWWMERRFGYHADPGMQRVASGDRAQQDLRNRVRGDFHFPPVMFYPSRVD